MNWRRVGRAAAALMAGYAVIVVVTTLGFNVALGGRVLYGEPPLILLAATAIAVIAGLLGGYLAGVIGPFRGSRDALLVLIPLCGDTAYVLFFLSNPKVPMWFDAIGSATLMIFTIAGGFFQERGRTGPRRSRATVRT